MGINQIKMNKIRRALISLSDKQNLKPLLQCLKKNKIEITLQKEGPFVLDVIESVNQENKLKA